MAARAGVEPTNLRLKAIDSTKAPSCPTQTDYVTRSPIGPIWLPSNTGLCTRDHGHVDGRRCRLNFLYVAGGRSEISRPMRHCRVNKARVFAPFRNLTSALSGGNIIKRNDLDSFEMFLILYQGRHIRC